MIFSSVLVLISIDLLVAAHYLKAPHGGTHPSEPFDGHLSSLFDPATDWIFGRRKEEFWKSVGSVTAETRSSFGCSNDLPFTRLLS